VKLPPGVFSYLLIGYVVIPFLINVAVNVGLGLLTFSGSKAVPVWALEKGAVADFLGCCFFLPLITCLIATPIVHRQAASGVVSRIPAGDAPRWAHFFRGPLLLRNLKWGAAGLIVFAGPVVGSWCLVTHPTVETSAFLIAKTLFAGVLGIVVTPLIAIAELSDEPPRGSAETAARKG
jgi:hypothetical protein